MKILKLAIVLYLLAMIISLLLAVIKKDSPIVMASVLMMFVGNMLLFYKTMSEIEHKKDLWKS